LQRGVNLRHGLVGTADFEGRDKKISARL